METVRPCGCKGIRTCLICEKEYNILKPNLFKDLQNKSSYSYCPICKKAWQGWNWDIYKQHPDHKGDFIEFPGVFIKLDFLTDSEAQTLLNDLDKLPWEPSQSGRRKQNFGPKCNFKKKRLRLGAFEGFPKETKFIQEKFQAVPELSDFQTIEQCSLEYNPERGASIDPHIDDCWIWGERIVTVCVLGDSVLTMTPYKGPKEKYNLQCVEKILKDVELEDAVVRIPMPEKSLLILTDLARYNWEHAVLREDVTSRRVCLAYREFTDPYLPRGTKYQEARDVFDKAAEFW